LQRERVHDPEQHCTDIVVDGGWFSSAPYLVSERSHHALSLMDKKEHLEEFLHHFR
jgi:hypothetical protein